MEAIASMPNGDGRPGRFWHLLLLLAALLLALCHCSCSRRAVPDEARPMRHGMESEQTALERVYRDSLFFFDTVYAVRMGDTMTVNHLRTVNHFVHHIAHDTLRSLHRDTVVVGNNIFQQPKKTTTTLWHMVSGFLYPLILVLTTIAILRFPFSNLRERIRKIASWVR